MNKSKNIHCDICDTEVDYSKWDQHILTDIHREMALTKIMEGRIGKEISPFVRDETTEILEELEQDYENESKND